MVQAKTLNEIEQAWRAAGEPYCDHPRSDDEFYVSARSGDKGCLDCGDTWPKGSKSEPRGNRTD